MLDEILRIVEDSIELYVAFHKKAVLQTRIGCSHTRIYRDKSIDRHKN